MQLFNKLTFKLSLNGFESLLIWFSSLFSVRLFVVVLFFNSSLWNKIAFSRFPFHITTKSSTKTGFLVFSSSMNFSTELFFFHYFQFKWFWNSSEEFLCFCSSLYACLPPIYCCRIDEQFFPPIVYWHLTSFNHFRILMCK